MRALSRRPSMRRQSNKNCKTRARVYVCVLLRHTTATAAGGQRGYDAKKHTARPHKHPAIGGSQLARFAQDL